MNTKVEPAFESHDATGWVASMSVPRSPADTKVSETAYLLHPAASEASLSSATEEEQSLPPQESQAVALQHAIEESDSRRIRGILQERPGLLQAWRIDPWSSPPLHYALQCRWGDDIPEKPRLEVVRALLESAVEDDVMLSVINATDGRGCTALHLAVAFEAIAQYLLHTGAEVDPRDHDGFTPLRCAILAHQSRTIAVLLSFGAKTDAYDMFLQTPMDCARGRAGCFLVEEEEEEECDILALFKKYDRDLCAWEARAPRRYTSSLHFNGRISALFQYRDRHNGDLSNAIQTRYVQNAEKPVFEMLYAAASLAEEVGRRQLISWSSASSSSSAQSMSSCWIHFPATNFQWLQIATDKIFLPRTSEQGEDGAISSSGRDSAVKYYWMRVFMARIRLPLCLTTPKYHRMQLPGVADGDAFFAVLPVITMDVQQPRHHDHKTSSDEGYQRRRDVQQTARQIRDCWNAGGRPSQVTEHVVRLGELHEAFQGEIPSAKTLDEYCYEFLGDQELARRDRTQVISRYLERKRSRDHERVEAGRNQERVEAGRNQERDHDLEGGARTCEKGLNTRDQILVVSQIWIWRVKDLVITAYPEEWDCSNKRSLPHEIQQRYDQVSSEIEEAGNARQQHGLDSWSTNTEGKRMARVIVEECFKYEPHLSDGGGSYLNAFASEIAFVSGQVTKAYEEYKKCIGQTARTFKDAIRKETDYLLMIDDILDELAMLRRVQEEKELVCRDIMEFEDKEQQNKLGRWMKQAQMKLKRLEEDAQRVRMSLVTLLDLRQRQVNAEGVVNSELQSQIFVVFTAATVVFTPLSWISSLMALDIVDFSPPNSQPWSRNQALAASLVTMAASVVLILLCLIGWRWYEHMNATAQHEDPSTVRRPWQSWKKVVWSTGRQKREKTP